MYLNLQTFYSSCGVQVLVEFLDYFQDFFLFSYLYSVLFSKFADGLSVVVSFFQVIKVFGGFFPVFYPPTLRSKHCSLSFAIVYWTNEVLSLKLRIHLKWFLYSAGYYCYKLGCRGDQVTWKFQSSFWKVLLIFVLQMI